MLDAIEGLERPLVRVALWHAVQCDDLGRFQSQPRVFCFVAQDLADELGGLRGQLAVFAQGAVDIARAARRSVSRLKRLERCNVAVGVHSHELTF